MAEWYAISVLRLEIFVVEQNCPYQDFDGKDQKSIHLWAESEDGTVAAYLRIPAPGVSYAEPSIGRVVVKADFRGRDLGRQLMQRGIAACQRHFGPLPIRISAQEYLLRFYSDLGFVATGKSYLEDNIPHAEMIFNPTLNHE